MLILLILKATADNLFYNDYTNNAQYNWSALQGQSEYILDLGSETIQFSFGSNLKFPCKGEKASVIKFSKSNNDCTVLGKHEFSYYSTFTALNNPGIDIFYKEGSLCEGGSNRKWTEFRFICSQEEHDFGIWSIGGGCRTVIQKYTRLGCPKAIVDNFIGKALICASYGLGAFLIFYVIVEVCGYWEIGKKGAEEFEEEKKLIVKIRGKDRKVLNFDESHIYL